mmetsp:Transcript_119794/g.382392  ORF Transcript_119794/g.382392 Transcript_119794/m.382392 type:complete len:206 (+) Transcript_119794:73-690(+)
MPQCIARASESFIFASRRRAHASHVKSKMRHVRLSNEPLSMAVCRITPAASFSTVAGGTRASWTLLTCSQTRSTTNWSSNTSQTPSLARTTNTSRPGSKVCSPTSGSALTKGLAAWLPKLRDVAMPFTRAGPRGPAGASTAPPKASMRRRSLGRLGLWSSVRRTALNSLSRRRAFCLKGFSAPSLSMRTTYRRLATLRTSTMRPR